MQRRYFVSLLLISFLISYGSTDSTGSNFNPRRGALVSAGNERVLNRVKRDGVDASEVTSILNSLLRDYDKRLRPQYGGPPVEVKITLNMVNIGPLNEKDMTIRMDFVLRQYWKDERLAYAQTTEDINMSPEFLPKIWKPG